MIDENEYSEKISELLAKADEFQKANGWNNGQMMNAFGFILALGIMKRAKESPSCIALRMMIENLEKVIADAKKIMAQSVMGG